MQSYIALGLGVGAIVLMFYCLWLVMTLKRVVPGGVIGQRWNILMALVVFFALGYLAIPFVGRISMEQFYFMLTLILFLGAVYVLTTIRLIYSVIDELND